MKILIAFDGSEFSERALADLPHAGFPQTLEATVLTVADVLMPPGTDWRMLIAQTDLPAAVLVARQRAGEAIEGAQATAERGAGLVRGQFPNWRVEARSASDSPAWGIIKAAADLKSDLVVVGSHGRGIVQRFFLGGVSQRVVTDAVCSVRIVRPGAEPRREGAPTLMIAADGSEESVRAVQAVCARTWPAGTRVHVVTVIDPRMESAVAWPGVYASQWVQRHDADSREWISRVAERFERDLEAAGLRAEMHVFDGDPRQALLKQAEEFGVDTIFVGAHGLQHGQRPALGGVASALASRAHCAVEVVRGAA